MPQFIVFPYYDGSLFVHNNDTNVIILGLTIYLIQTKAFSAGSFGNFFYLFVQAFHSSIHSIQFL